MVSELNLDDLKNKFVDSLSSTNIDNLVESYHMLYHISLLK